MKAATAAYRRGDWDPAARDFAEARRAYLDAGQPILAAQAANNLSVTLLQAGRAQPALDAVLGTPETLLAAGETGLAAQAQGNLGAALEACDRLEEAEQAFIRSIELFSETPDEENRALSLQALSRIQLRLGKPIQALGSMQSGLEGAGRLSPTRRLLRKLLRLPGRLLNNR